MASITNNNIYVHREYSMYCVKPVQGAYTGCIFRMQSVQTIRIVHVGSEDGE